MPMQTSQMDGVVQAMWSSIGFIEFRTDEFRTDGLRQASARDVEMAQKFSVFQPNLDHSSFSYNHFTINYFRAYGSVTFDRAEVICGCATAARTTRAILLFFSIFSCDEVSLRASAV